MWMRALYRAPSVTHTLSGALSQNTNTKVNSYAINPQTMSHTVADLLRWIHSNQDQALYYRLFNASFYLNHNWISSGKNEYKIKKSELRSWMRKLITRLQSVQNWSFNLRQTAPQPDPLGPPLKRATTPGMEIARDDKTWIYISDAIFEYSKRHEPSLKAFDMIRMTDRILTWTTSFTGNYADAKSDIEKMLGIEKRPSNYRQFPSYVRSKSLNCVYCKTNSFTQTDHVMAWDRWGKRGHYEVNWLPSCRTCNNNKSNEFLGLGGWELVEEFYTDVTLGGPTFVAWIKTQLPSHITWNSHFQKAKMYYQIVGITHMWEGVGNISLHNKAKSQQVCNVIERISRL